MDLWETNETVVAAVLAYFDHEIVDLDWDDDVCFFHFRRCPELLGIVADFVAGEIMVEPKQFNRTFGKVRARMFGHPDAPNRGRHNRPDRSVMGQRTA